MSAPQTVGTPAATSVTADSHGLDALLTGDLSGDDGGAQPGDDLLDAIAGNAAATDGDTEQTEPEVETEAAEPKDAAAKLDDEVIFSDEALATPEGIKKGRERVKQLRRMTHEKYLELKNFEGRVVKRHGKLKHQIQTHVNEKRNHELLLGNVRSNLQGLHSNDPDTILTALGNLTGTDGVKAYELLTSRIVNRGRPQLDPQIQAIIDAQEQKIEELRKGFGERDAQAKVGQLTQKLNEHAQQIGNTITSGAAHLPHLARLYADDPHGVTKYIVDEITEAHQRGTPLDGRQYFSTLESQLAKHFGVGQAPQGDGGGPAPKQPSTVQRSPGQSVGPRTASASNPREPSEEESLKALANDQTLMSAFGF
jgi:hypothetical protein